MLAASFVLLYRTARFRRVTDGLRFYGRMSLTNYIAQSVVGALIFFPFGLGLASRCGYALSLVIGVAVFVLQAAFLPLVAARPPAGTAGKSLAPSDVAGREVMRNVLFRSFLPIVGAEEAQCGINN